MTLLDAGIVAYFALLVLTGWWATIANRQWLQRVTSRGLNKDYGPGGLEDRAATSMRASIEYIARGPASGLRLDRLRSAPDTDPATETWRIRSTHRMRMVVAVALLGWALPTAAVLFPIWLSSLPPMRSGLLLVFLAAAVAIFVVQAIRLAVSIKTYGDGEDLGLGRVIRDAVGIGIVLAFLAVSAFFLG